MIAGFIFIKTDLGKMEDVANKVIEIPQVSEVYSISGSYDILVKVYVNSYEDFVRVIPGTIHAIPGIRETNTLITFNSFK
ncbi:MAG: Lrp/AsnC family transcriptional regulator [Nitrospinota bacterium]|nr:MAG: Lrp/AsnC family transcriptional regulator [Nitrospinota bacterium]